MDVVHTPVLLQECLTYLSPVGETYEKDAFMVDATLGEGGHSYAFLSTYPDLVITGVDADAVIQQRARERLCRFGKRMNFYHGWFNDFFCTFPSDARQPDLILFDLGISVFHYECSGRGFSFRKDELLDMRLNGDSPISAETIINTYQEKSLADLIYLYGEERYSRKIATAIVVARQASPIKTADVLADIIYRAVPAGYRHGSIHPATKTFQALRIAVNKELFRLPKVLPLAFNTLNIGGKMGVITFHSLEDRIVKKYFRNLAKQCVCPPEQPICICGGMPSAEILTHKPVVPSGREVNENSPSRSAKLRVIRKLHEVSDERARFVLPETV